MRSSLLQIQVDAQLCSVPVTCADGAFFTMSQLKERSQHGNNLRKFKSVPDSRVSTGCSYSPCYELGLACTASVQYPEHSLLMGLEGNAWDS